MSKKYTISEEDLAAFKNANRGTRPIKTKPRVEKTPPRPTKRRYRAPEAPEDTLPLFVDRDETPHHDSDAILIHKHASISNKILRNLGKAQYNIEAVLDLHGFTAAKAEIEVDAFLKHCLLTHRQVVLIIHGKGAPGQMPVLKNKIYQWLSQIEEVLAFSSAAPAQGGKGALVVLLKRKQEEI